MGVMSLTNVKIENLNIQSDVFVLLSATFIMDSVEMLDITRDIASVVRIFRVEDESVVNITNSKFFNINSSLASFINSVLQVDNTTAINITAAQYVIEWYSSSGIVLQNFTIIDSKSTEREAMIHFKNWEIERISESYFTESQLLVFLIIHTKVKLFENNVLNGMNRGMKIVSRSTLIIKNTMFINMKQNIKEGVLYFSEIIASGSAIGNFIFFLFSLFILIIVVYFNYIEIIDSDVQIDNSTFKDNIGYQWGCNFN